VFHLSIWMWLISFHIVDSKTPVTYQRYIAKSNPWIVVVLSPNAPEGLFERIDYLGEIILGLRLNRSYWSQKRSTILGVTTYRLWVDDMR
jgi:hypothetical protein